MGFERSGDGTVGRPADRGRVAKLRVFGLAHGVVAVAVGLLLLCPSPALAVFTRPFVRQLKRTPAGPLAPEGVTADSAGKVWVGNGEKALSVFGSSGVFVETIGLEGSPTTPGSISIAQWTNDLYVTSGMYSLNPPKLEIFDSAGKLVRQCGAFNGNPFVAVDNSRLPFAGPVYVSHGRTDPNPPVGDGLPAGVEKLDGECKQVGFTEKAGYISGGQIVGTPGGPFGNVEADPRGVAVDAGGNLYVIGGVVHAGHEEPEAVYEYEPSGRLVGEFTGKETPGLGTSRDEGGWGSRLRGVTVDPVSGDVLVSVDSPSVDEGAVDEFDAAGRFLKQITATEVEVSPGVREPSRLHSAEAMTGDANGDLYVVDRASNHTNEHAVDEYGPGKILPTLTLAEASQRTRTSAIVGGTVDPGGLALSDCHFEYVTEAAFTENVKLHGEGFADLSSGGQAACNPSATAIAPNGGAQPVDATLTGLTSGVTYRYRLLATTSGGLGGPAASESLAFTTPHAPQIDSTSVERVSSEFADLRASIAPLGADTSYRFQYVDEADYAPGAGDPYAAGASVPVPVADIGAGGPTGGADATVVQQIGSLTPGTVYHFHVVAENTVEGETQVTAGPDRTFTTLAHATPGVLPDGRAYEPLTPPNKGSAADMFDGQVENNEFENPNDTGVPSESGDRFLLMTPAAFGSFAAAHSNVYLFARGAAGWAMRSADVPSLGFGSLEAKVVDSADLSQVGIDDHTFTAGVGERLVSLVGPAGGPYTTLRSDALSSKLKEGEESLIAGASRDLGHVILQGTSRNLCPGAETQDERSNVLCEWAGGSEPVGGEVQPELRLVNANSQGEPLDRCGAVLGAGAKLFEAEFGEAHNAVSVDGSIVFFTSPDPTAENRGPDCWEPPMAAGQPERNAPQLYMRSAGETTELSLPAGGGDPCHPVSSECHRATYVGASEDGSKVFFLSEAELTGDDAGVHDPELYMYDTRTRQLTRISAGESGHAAADVQRVPAVSADGSTVYFTAAGEKLTAAAPVTSPRQVELYRYDTDAPAASATTFIATLGFLSYYPAFGDKEHVALLPQASWYTTPNDRYLLFATSSEIPSVGYSTLEATGVDCPSVVQAEAGSDHHCAEVYRYDSSSGAIVCVSCNPSGAAPVSNAFFDRSAPLMPADGSVRAMSDDGSKVFFDTADALVPQDSNGTLDVYEWEAQGTGGCELTKGCVHLISSGEDPAPSYFLGTTPDASNVFFGTHARLVPQDTDSYGDLYDARECTTGNPCIKPPAGETAQCEGDACQSPPPAPIDATPGSLTFAGAGNVDSEVRPKLKQCARGKVRAKGKCVQKQRKKCKQKGKAKHCRRARHATRTSRRAGR